MTSPRKTDSGRSFSFRRVLEVDSEHSKLTETIENEGGTIQRSVFIPTKTPDISIRRRIPLSEKQSRAEREAYRIFQEETGRRRYSDPPKLDTLKLSKISKAERKSQVQQQREAQALRRSQREISMIEAALAEDDDEYFKKHTEDLRCKLLSEPKTVTNNDVEKELQKVEDAIRNEDELKQVLDDVEDYYQGVGNALEDLKEGIHRKYLAGRKEVEDAGLDPVEYSDAIEFIKEEYKADLNRLEELKNTLDVKYPSKSKRIVSEEEEDEMPRQQEIRKEQGYDTPAVRKSTDIMSSKPGPSGLSRSKSSEQQTRFHQGSGPDQQIDSMTIKRHKLAVERLKARKQQEAAEKAVAAERAQAINAAKKAVAATARASLMRASITGRRSLAPTPAPSNSRLNAERAAGIAAKQRAVAEAAKASISKNIVQARKSVGRARLQTKESTLKLSSPPPGSDWPRSQMAGPSRAKTITSRSSLAPQIPSKIVRDPQTLSTGTPLRRDTQPDLRQRALTKPKTADLRSQRFVETQQEPPKPPPRTASQKYIGGTDFVKLKTKAKQDFDAACAAAKQQIDDREELGEHLEFLKEELNSNIDFINKFESARAAVLSKYMQDKQKINGTALDSIARQQAEQELNENLKRDLMRLERAAGIHEGEIALPSDKEIGAELTRRKRFAQQMAQRKKAAEAQRTAEAAAKAMELEKRARMERTAQAAKAALASRKSIGAITTAKSASSRASLPSLPAAERSKLVQPSPTRQPRTSARGAPSHSSIASAKARSVPRQTTTPAAQAARSSQRATVAAKRRRPDDQGYLESLNPPPKPLARTASQKYIAGTDLIKLKTKANQDFRKAVLDARATIKNKQDLDEHINFLKNEHQNRMNFINNLDEKKHQARKKYLTEAEQSKNVIAEPTALQETLAKLRENLVATLSEIERTAGTEPRQLSPLSDKEIAQQVTRHERLKKLAEDKRRAEMDAKALTEATAAKIARSRASLAPRQSLAPSRSRALVSSAKTPGAIPATVPRLQPTQRTTLQSAKAPSMIRKISVPRMTLKKKPLEPRLERFLEQQKPVEPKKPIAKTASQKYVSGTDARALVAKAKDEYNNQKQLAMQLIPDENEKKDHLEYLQQEYASKLNFIKNMDTYKNIVQKRHYNDVQAAKKGIKDKDVLKERLDFLREELENKLALIEEAAGLPRRSTFRTPTAQARDQVAQTVYKLATAAPKVPKKQLILPPNVSDTSQMPVGQPSLAATGRSRSMVSRRPTASRSAVKAKSSETLTVAAISSRSKTSLGGSSGPPREPQQRIVKTMRALSKSAGAKLISRSSTRPIDLPALEATAASEKPAITKKSLLMTKRAKEERKKYLEQRRAQEVQKPKPKRPPVKKMVLKKKSELPPRLQKFVEERKTVQKTAVTASQRYLPVAELNFYKGQAKRKYEEDVAQAKKTVRYEDDLEDHLDFLLNEYKAQIGFIADLPNLRKSAKEKYLIECEKVKELYQDDDRMLQNHLALLEGEYAAKLKQLKEVASGHQRPQPNKFEQLNKRLLQPAKRAVSDMSVDIPQKKRKVPPWGPRPSETSKMPTTSALMIKKSTAPIKTLQKGRLVAKPFTPSRIKGKSIRDAQEKSPEIATPAWKVPKKMQGAIRKKKVLQRTLERTERDVTDNKEILQAVEGTKPELPIPKASLYQLAKQMGIDPENEVGYVADKAQRKTEAIRKTLASVPPTVAESVQQREQFAISALASEEADGIFRMMMDEAEGIDLKKEPGEIVRLIVPSEGPTLAVAGNAVESLSRGVITDQVPVREINALSDRNAEEFASTVKQQPRHNFPSESIATKKLQDSQKRKERPGDEGEAAEGGEAVEDGEEAVEADGEALPEQPTESPAREAKSRENYIQHDLLLHSFRVENYFQTRGSVFPKWFPGIYTVFPEENPKLVLKKSPSEILYRAWQVMKPNYVAKT